MENYCKISYLQKKITFILKKNLTGDADVKNDSEA